MGIFEDFAAGSPRRSPLLDLMDVRDYMYYDRLRVPPGMGVPAVWSLFQTPFGQGDPITGTFKTLLDTNMWVAGRLPPPTVFSMQRLFFLFDPLMDSADRDRLASNYVYELQLADKISHRGPLLRFPTVATIGEFYDVDAAGLAGEPSDQRFCRRALKIEPPFCVSFELPHVVENDMSFELRLIGESFEASASCDGGAGISLWACLDGLGAFAVQ